jgi:hypothetical protein
LGGVAVSCRTSLYILVEEAFVLAPSLVRASFLLLLSLLNLTGATWG